MVSLRNGSGITKGEAELITDRLAVELFNTGKVVVMERGQMEEVLKEQGFQQSGACTEEECLVEMGQMLGVQSLVSGSIGKLGSMYMVNVRMISVKTAEITQVVSEDITGGIEQVVDRLPGVARRLVRHIGAGEAGSLEQGEPEPEPASEAEPEPAEDTEPEPEQDVLAEESDSDGAFPATPVVETTESGTVSASTDRYHNPGGMHFLLAWYPADMTWYEKEYVSGGRGTWVEKESMPSSWYDSLAGEGYDVAFFNNRWRLGMRFSIPVGPVLAFDFGAGLDYFREFRYFNSMLRTSRREWELKIMAPTIGVGFGFVKTWPIIKIRATMSTDMNLNFITFSNEYDFGTDSLGNPETGSFDEADFRMSACIGPRIGVEVLPTPTLGINFDLNYSYNRITTDMFNETADYEDRFVLPSLGIGTGVNLYIRSP